MRKRQSGFQVIHMVGLMLITLMLSPIAIDFGYYFAAKNQLQTAADAASLSGTAELYKSTSLDLADREEDVFFAAEDLSAENQDLFLEEENVELGYIDPDSKFYDPSTFNTPDSSPEYAFTGGYNAVRVNVRRDDSGVNSPLPTIMAGMLGVREMHAGSDSIAMMEQVSAMDNAGIRPIYACEAQFRLASQDRILENNRIRVFGDRMEVDGVANIPGCPAPGSGNWGFADLRDCHQGAPSAETVGTWFSGGFPGSVQAGQCYSTQPGSFLVNNNVQSAIDELIANETVIYIPIYDTYSGGGSNTTVGVKAFAGFVITDYQAQGNSSQRYIEGYFTRGICNKGCTGKTPTDETIGMTVVKLRLASRDL